MKEALEAALERTDIWLMVFTAIVAFGVGGEAVFGMRHWLLSRRLRSIRHTEELRLSKEIEDARRDANQAKAQSDSFQAAIADANARAKSAEAQVASANSASREAVAKVASAEARIAEANRAASEAGAPRAAQATLRSWRGLKRQGV